MWPFTDPSKAANQYYNQIPGTISPYYQPYIQNGMNAMNQLMPQYSSMMSDPGGYLNNMGKGFQQSPGYQFQVDQSLGAANRAASAGGMLGSPEEQQNIGTTVNGLANQDYYNWINHATGMLNTGLQGMQGMENQGFNASGDLAQSLASNLASQGNMAYSGAVNRNQMYGNMIGEGMGMVGSMFGGPLGGMAGGMLGNMFGGNSGHGSSPGWLSGDNAAGAGMNAFMGY